MALSAVGVGGHVGNPRAFLLRRIGVPRVGKEVRLVARSSDYRTPPWGFKYQPHFVNLAIVVETTLGPRELLARAQEVELRLGRDRTHEKRNGPRTADIDILAYDDLTLDLPDLQLPHPRLLARAFMLAPLAEIAADKCINGVRVEDALGRLDCSGIEKLPPR
jgi:2-amino-4-hydroxy-6-hydroxymethyldihydropteridine diphosphokinase